MNDLKQGYVEKGRKDPVFFIENFLGMQLHEGQKKYLKSAKKALDNGDNPLIRRFVLTCANRWGKTALIACLQLWYLFYKFGIQASGSDWVDIEYRTANIAPLSPLTEPVFMAMKAIMTSSYPIRDGKTGEITTNKCQIEALYLKERTINNPPYKMYFANNSYIEHLSLMGGKGDNLQGKPYGLITYDEAPRSNHLQVEMDNSILGRLLDWTAPLHLVGTSDNDSRSLLYFKKLYDEGMVGVNDSLTQTGSIYQNSFMTKKQIDNHVRMLEGNPLRDQMLEGKIILNTQAIFPGKDILAAQDKSLNDGETYQEGHTYTFGIDTAIGNDEMVYHVIDTTVKPYRKVYTEAVKGSARSPQMHMNVLINLVEAYRDGDNLQIALETFNGEAARFYTDLPPYIRQFTYCYGSWQPNALRTDNDNPLKKKTGIVQKADLIIALQKILAAHELKIPDNDYKLTEQLQIYREDDKNIPTDRVMALALAVWLAEDRSKVDRPVFKTIEW